MEKHMGRSIDALPKNTLWTAITGTSLVATPSSVVLGVAGIWTPVIGTELLWTAALSLFVGLTTGLVSACWIVDDEELNDYRRLGSEGRAQVRREVEQRRVQIEIARQERMLGYSDKDGKFDERRALGGRKAHDDNDDGYFDF